MVHRSLSRLVLAVLLVFGAFAIAAPPADAHSELLQASPRASSVVGGEFHSISLQFGGIDETANFRAQLLDPAGVPIGEEPVSENSRIVIPIEPLVAPGIYTVSYTTVGVDGDVTSDTFTFRFDPAAAEPEPITIEFGTQDRFGLVGWLLVCFAAGLLGYLVHRFMYAWRAHRIDQEHAERAEQVDASG